MKIEFPALESEPLIYFLFHSGVFVIALGTLFFLLGLVMGWLIWARHKRNNRRLTAEQEALQAEVISLKQKLTEQAIRPPSRPLSSPPVKEALPAIEPAPSIKADEAAPQAETPPVPPVKDIGLLETFPQIPALVHELGSSGIRKGLALSPLRARPVSKTATEPAVPLTPLKPRRFPMPDETEAADAAAAIEPFSFLMGPEPEVVAKPEPEVEPATKPQIESSTPEDSPAKVEPSIKAAD